MTNRPIYPHLVLGRPPVAMETEAALEILEIVAAAMELILLPFASEERRARRRRGRRPSLPRRMWRRIFG